MIKSKNYGLPPGSLIHIGEKKVEKTRITVIDYNEEEFNELEVKRVEECFFFKDKASVTWINISGIHDENIIGALGRHFSLHPLLLEDVMDSNQRPKVEDYEDYLFIILKMLYLDKEVENQVATEQVSLVLGRNYVISFQESDDDVFDIIRNRIRQKKGRVRSMGADYLAYVLMDAIVDNYFVVMERFKEVLEDIHESLIVSPRSEMLHLIHDMKREMIFLRKSVWPLRDVVRNLQQTDFKWLEDRTTIFLRDLYDHTIQVMDSIESSRDLLSGILDIYLSSVSYKMNEVMKVLTIIATIFIPLTFIAGVYGMNFHYMPELDWKWGYPLIWVVMIATFLAMVYYFKRKEWL